MHAPYTPHPYAPPPPRSGWPPAARWAVGCGSCCVAGVLLQGLLIWGMLYLFMGMQPPEGLTARVATPPSVVAGRQFPLTLEIRNEGETPLNITNILASQETVRSFQLSNPRPAPASSTSSFGTTVWSYQRSLAPGQKWSVRFDATVSEPGAESGALQVQAGLSGPLRVPFTVSAASRKPAAGTRR